MSVVTIWLLFLVVVQARLGGGYYDSLACWLQNLQIHLPDETFHKNIFSVSIHNLTCTRYEIRSIRSNYKNSTTPIPTMDKSQADPSIDVSVYGVSAACFGMYQSGLTSGSIQIYLTSNTSLSNHVNQKEQDHPPNIRNDDDDDDESIVLQMSLPSTPMYWNTSSPIDMRIPLSINVTSCHVLHLQVPLQDGIIFSGSISASLMELFAGMIAKHITTSMTSQLCPSLDSGIHSFFTTQIIQPMNDYLIPLIIHTNNETISPFLLLDDEPFIQWDLDIPILQKVLLDVNHVLSHHRNKGLVLSWLDDFTCDTDCGYFFQGFNGWLRHWSFNRNGTFSFPSKMTEETPPMFQFSIPIHSYGKVHIQGLSIQIKGLDSFDQLFLAYPLESLDMEWNMSSSQGWDVIAELHIRVEPTGDDNQDKVLEETFTVHIQTSHVILTLILQLGVEKSTFNQVTMRDILHHLDVSSNNHWIPSRLGLKEAYIPRLDMNTWIQKLEIHPAPYNSPSFLFTLENDFDDLIDTMTRLILQEYDTYVTQAIRALVYGPLRLILNDKLEQSIPNATVHSVSPSLRFDNSMHLADRMEEVGYTPSYGPGVFDWNMTSLSLNKLNTYIECILQVLALAINQTVLPLAIINMWDHELKLTINSWDIDKADQMINQIDIQGNSDFHVYSAVKALQCDASENADNHHLQTSLSMSLEIPSLWVYAELDLALEMANISSELRSRVQYDIDKFQSLLLHEVLKNASKIFYPLESFNVLDWVSYIDQAELLFNLSLFMGKVSIDTIFINGTQSIASVFNSLTSIMFGVTTAFINAHADHQIHKDSTPTDSNIKRKETLELWACSYVCIYLVVCIVLMNAVYLRSGYFFDTRTKNRKKKELSSTRHNQIFQLSPEVKKKLSSTLMFHPSIDFSTQFLLPLVIIGTIVIFISSNLSIGASVDLIFRNLDGSSVSSFPNLFIFSLGKTIQEMYQAGVYLLMALVLLFSGVFPYVKLLLLLCAWICPEHYLNQERRHKILSLLNAYGKYSLVDSFVLVLMLVSFHFELNILGSWSTFVTPDYGFYSFMLATVLSLLLGHYLVYLHRTSLSYTASTALSPLSTRETLWNHPFKDKNTGKRYRRLSPFAKYGWMALFGISSMSIIVGFGSPFIEFEFQGLVGSLLGSRKSERYSLISLGRAIPKSAIHPSVGIFMIQWTYFFFTMFMPLLTLAVIAIMCNIPMTIGEARRVIILAEICNAWNALDVFLVSIVASLLELSTFANFMVGHNCDVINRILKENFDNILDGQDFCFGIHTSIGRSSTLLIAGTLLQSLLISISLKVAHVALSERAGEETHYGNRMLKDNYSIVRVADILPDFFFLYK